MEKIITDITLQSFGNELIKIRSNGEFYYNGRLITKDDEIFLLFKEFLKKDLKVSELDNL